MTSQPPYVSDDLTHFVGRNEETDGARFALLKTILSTGVLQRGSAAAVGPSTIRINRSASIAERTMYDPDVVCFCDIPLRSLGIHMKKYSEFGIAFAKKVLARAGASPVFYVARGSTIVNPENLMYTRRGERFDEMIRRFHSLMDELQAGRGETVVAHDPSGQVIQLRHAPSDDPVISVRHFFDSEVLPFITFFDEQLGEEHRDNYYMEREWRKKGPVSFEIQDVSRLIMPRAFAEKFRGEMPSWLSTPIHSAENPEEALG